MELTQIQKIALREAYLNARADHSLRIRDCHSTLVREYLKLKDRRTYYMVSYDTYKEDGCDYQYLRPLSDENIADIKATIKQLDPNDEYDFDDLVCDTPEALSDKEYLKAYGRFDEELYVTKVNLAEKHYCYEFKVAHFSDGVEGQSTISRLMIALTDEEYIYLTAECMAKWTFHYVEPFTINRLRTANPALYDKICSTIESSHFDVNCYPHMIPVYAVEIVECEADAQLLASIIED